MKSHNALLGFSVQLNDLILLADRNLLVEQHKALL